MSYEKKLPPFRVTITENEFNKLLSIIEDDNKELKDKLMKYTFTKEDNKAELRLFPYEAECIFLLLFKNLKEADITDDYYQKLVNIRSEYIQNQQKIGGETDA